MEQSNEQKNVGRAQSTRQGFAGMSQEQLIAKAKAWNDARILRAAGQVAEYRMIGSDGQILNLATGATYECEDVRRWEALPGSVMYIGCDCEDEQNRLAPLRDAMLAARCGSPCYCKHYYLRLLFDGAKIRTSGNLRIRLKGTKPN